MRQRRAPRFPPSRDRLRATALAALAVLVLWLPSAGWFAPRQARLWRGYQTLAVRADLAGEMAAVVQRLGPGVVSDLSATVDFWDFTGLARVPYAELDARLDPSDPRRDPFMNAASGYFRAPGAAAGWRIAYIPASETDFRLFLRATRWLGFPIRGEWRLADFDPVVKALSLAALFGLAVLLGLSLEEGRRRSLALTMLGAFLWTPSLLSGNLSQLAASMMLLLAWFPLMRERVLRPDGEEPGAPKPARPILLFVGVAAAGLMLSLLTQGFSLSLLVGFLSPVFASLILLSALPPFFQRAQFTPIPIVRPSSNFLLGRSAALLLAALSLVLVAVTALSRGLTMPTPDAVSGARGFSWGSLGRLGGLSDARRLPDFADLVTHVAFQETIAFGRPWRLPVRDERVYIREFQVSPANGSIVAQQRTVKVFDSAWLESVGRRSLPGSLEALLFAQGRPVVVRLQGPWHALVKELPTALFVLLAFLTWLGNDLGLGLLIRVSLPRFNEAAAGPRHIRAVPRRDTAAADPRRHVAAWRNQVP